MLNTSAGCSGPGCRVAACSTLSPRCRRWRLPASCSASASCGPISASSAGRRFIGDILDHADLVLAVRRLPYALRAATAALRQVRHRSLEEAAENLGAGKTVTLARIVVPLMAGGPTAAFVTSFATAAVELSATLVLVTRDVDAAVLRRIHLLAGLQQGATSAAWASRGRRRRTLPGRRMRFAEQRTLPVKKPAGTGHERAGRGCGRLLRLRRATRGGERSRSIRGRVLCLPRPIGQRQDHAAAP